MDWQHIRNFYQAGFPFPTPTPIRVRNLGVSTVEVQFRSVLDSSKTISAMGCEEYNVYAYAEAWFRSPNGEAVTIDCDWGSCVSGLDSDSNRTISNSSVRFTDDDIDPQRADLFKTLISTYKKILKTTDSQ
jgi:hypothetical protein